MFYGTPLSKPDLDDICFHRNTGEFSNYTEIAFQNHLKKLSYWAGIFKNKNGDKEKLITRMERLWYQRAHSALSKW